MFGSHHTRLANYTAKLWNKLWLSNSGSSPGLLVLPEITAVSSNETFGLVNSECATTCGGILSEVKAAPRTEDPSFFTLDPDEDPDLHLDLQVEREQVVDEFEIDSSLFDVPMVRAPEHASSSRTASPDMHAKDGKVPPNAEVARPVEQTRSGIGRTNVHSPDTVTPGPLPHVDSSSLKRKAVERVDSTREGRGEPVPASKRLRTATMVHVATTSNASMDTPDGRGAASSVRSFVTTKRQYAPSDYAARVPLPPDGAGLTRLQRLFTISTGIHIDSLTIGYGDEFFIFMKLRARHKWASFRMTPLKWVEAMNLFNAELESVNRSHNRSTTLKNPRALVVMLGTVEATVIDRLATGNFKSKKGTETFWREHCHAVQLLKGGQLDGDRKGKTRKPASCPRCKRIMYPGPTKSPENHKRGYCSDGVRSKPPDNAPPGYLPLWPQPIGVFSSNTWGTTFNPIPFLATLRDVYEKAVLGGGQNDEAVEFGTFTAMLHSRIVVRADGAVFFRLYPEFELGPCPEGLFVKGDELDEGRGGNEWTSYVRVDCLRND
ncbi:hypothetical protein EDB85DRAFT_2083308 [Lactarius pseudohatsudake]|nr:hypothetical protein EDB85DRAFT_1208118 [Lactarius pseudohatsudake]KAH9041403.1 hypothetical protein EDB85DRAFT_2083308 [Lactarius pseudohatsudake]